MGVIQFPQKNRRNIAVELDLQIAKTLQKLNELAEKMQEAENEAMKLLQEYYRLATELFLLSKRAAGLERGNPDNAGDNAGDNPDNILPYPIIQLSLF